MHWYKMLLIANAIALLIPNLVSEWERVDPRPHLSSLLLWLGLIKSTMPKLGMVWNALMLYLGQLKDLEIRGQCYQWKQSKGFAMLVRKTLLHVNMCLNYRSIQVFSHTNYLKKNTANSLFPLCKWSKQCCSTSPLAKVINIIQVFLLFLI